MSKYGSKYGLFSLDSELVEGFWEKDDKHALLKALCLAECDLSEEFKKGFMLCRIDFQGNPFHMVACVKNSTSLYFF